MTGIQYLACLWTLLLTQTGFVCSDIQFMERNEGESVVLPCVIDPRDPLPYGVYLKRDWLHPKEMLFKYTKSNFTVNDDDNKNRISVSGDPSSHSLNVTISQLNAGDTDRYYCEFFVDSPSSVDDRIRGKTDFFLLVNAGPAEHPRSCSFKLPQYSRLLRPSQSNIPCLHPALCLLFLFHFLFFF